MYRFTPGTLLSGKACEPTIWQSQHRTSRSSPHRLPSMSAVRLLQSLACSGSRSDHGVLLCYSTPHIPQLLTCVAAVIDTTSWISALPTNLFFEPPIRGYDELSVPSYSFLIEHSSGRKLLFDLGIRKDWENLSPATAGLIDKIGPAKLEVKKGVREQLEEHGVHGSSIEGIIWSHWHFDHTGDPSTFDAHTTLIVGPGFKEAFVPGYPANQDSVILESDYAGRERKWHGVQSFRSPDLLKRLLPKVFGVKSEKQ